MIFTSTIHQRVGMYHVHSEANILKHSRAMSLLCTNLCLKLIFIGGLNCLLLRNSPDTNEYCSGVLQGASLCSSLASSLPFSSPLLIYHLSDTKWFLIVPGEAQETHFSLIIVLVTYNTVCKSNEKFVTHACVSSWLFLGSNDSATLYVIGGMDEWSFQRRMPGF